MNTSTSTITLLLAIVSGFVIAGLTATATSFATQPNVKAAASIESGKLVFNNRCSSCHAVESNKNSGFGPNLANIGADASSRINGMSRVQYILDSIVIPESYRAPDAIGHMPQGTLAGVSLVQAKELITYVAGLGAKPPSDKEFSALKVTPNMFELAKLESAELEVLQTGQSLFLEQLGCNSCHSIFNNPGAALFAPTLGHAANLSPEYIRESLRNPSAIIASGYSQPTVILNDGTEVSGQLLTENSSSLTILLRIPDGSVKTLDIARDDIADINYNTTSTMPQYNLSESDELALMAFLSSLSAEIPKP